MRFYDLLMVVGLAVVLAWTPVYLAQEPTDGLLAPGSSFVLPDVRIGDRIEYEMILHQHGASPATTGPVFVIEFLEPSKEQRADGVVLVQKMALPARNVDLGPAVFVQDERVDLHYYNPEGEIMSTHSTKHTSGLDVSNLFGRIADEDGPLVQSRVQEPGLHPGLTGFAPGNREITVLYEPPNTWETLLSSMKANAEPMTLAPAPTEPTAENVRQTEETAPFAAVHNNRTLYASQVEQEQWGKHWFLTGDPLWAPTENGVSLKSLSFEFTLTWKDPYVAEGRIEKWQWWAPDLPVQAGMHLSILDEVGNATHTIDFVPHEHEQGEGPVDKLDGQDWDPKYGHAPPISSTRMTTPDARNLPSFDHSAEIAAGRSLTDLHRTLTAPASPETIRGPVKDGAQLVGILWGVEAGDLKWLVAFHHQGAVRPALIEYTPTPQVHDVCGGVVEIAGRTVEPLCEIFEWGIGPHTHHGIGDELKKLQSLRKHLDQRWDGPMSEFGVLRPSLFAAAPPPGDPDRLRLGGSIDPFPGWPIATGGGVYVGKHGPESSIYTGFSFNSERRIYSETHRVESNPSLGSHQPQSLAMETARPELVHNLGNEPLIGGLIAVLVGVGFRVYVALRAGVHLPLFALLYAKIHKDEVLANKHRRTIASLVDSDPGIPLTQVAKQARLSHSGALHHLDTLVKTGRLQVTLVGRIRHYFPPEWTDSRARVRHAITKREGWEKLLALIESEPGLALHSLADRLEVTQSTVSCIGSRLESLGVLRKQKHGREVRFYPTIEIAKREP